MPRKETTRSKAPPATEKAPGQHLRELGLETWTARTVHRSSLVNAPYNPRVMPDEARRRLRAILKRHGAVAPPTWNKRTGNIVGGHQRMDALDALAGSADYTLTVAEIDVDEARERELNVALNNPQAQGDWEVDKLAEILKGKEIVLEGTGFGAGDLYRMFGASPFEEHEEELEKLAESVRKFGEDFKAAHEKTMKRHSLHYYVVVVFKDEADRDGFVEEFGLDDNRYQSGLDFREILRGGAKRGEAEG